MLEKEGETGKHAEEVKCETDERNNDGGLVCVCVCVLSIKCVLLLYILDANRLTDEGNREGVRDITNDESYKQVCVCLTAT